MNTYSQRGFVSMMAAVIISSMLLFMVVATGFSSIYSRSNILDSDLKARSVSAADGCADIALAQFALDPYYSAGTYSINELDECRVGKVAVSGGNREFWVQASSSDVAVTNLKIVIDANDLSIVSWEEKASY